MFPKCFKELLGPLGADCPKDGDKQIELNQRGVYLSAYFVASSQLGEGLFLGICSFPEGPSDP